MFRYVLQTIAAGVSVLPLSFSFRLHSNQIFLIAHSYFSILSNALYCFIFRSGMRSRRRAMERMANRFPGLVECQYELKKKKGRQIGAEANRITDDSVSDVRN